MATSTLQKDVVLLWTNASPSSSFGAQTVSLNLSDYSMVIISTLNVNTNSLTPTNIENSVLIVGAVGIARASTNSDGCRRGCTVSTSGIAFESAINQTTTVNTHCIPYKIYGIK